MKDVLSFDFSFFCVFFVLFWKVLDWMLTILIIASTLLHRRKLVHYNHLFATHNKKTYKQIIMVGQRRILVVICPKFLTKNLHLPTKFMYICIFSPLVVMDKLRWMVVMDKCQLMKWGVEHVFLCWFFCFNIIVHMLFNPSQICWTMHCNLNSMLMMNNLTIAHVLGERGFVRSYCIIVPQFVFSSISLCHFLFWYLRTRNLLPCKGWSLFKL